MDKINKKIVLIFLIILLSGYNLVYALLNFTTTSPKNEKVGGQFSTIIDNVTSKCLTNQYIQGFTSTGKLICQNKSSINGFTPGVIKNNYTKVGSGIYSKSLGKILNDCGKGRYLRGFDTNRNMICSDKEGNETLVGASISMTNGVSIIFPSTKPSGEEKGGYYTKYFTNILSNKCGEKEAIIGFNSNGIKTGCIDMPVCNYLETLSNGYYVIDASNTNCAQGCATPGLLDPNNKCILKTGTTYIAPGITDVQKTNTPCGGSASPCSTTTLTDNSNVMGYCENATWGGKEWYFPTYPTNTVNNTTKLLNENVGNYWTRHCENCDKTTSILWRINDGGGSKQGRSNSNYVRCESNTTGISVNGVCGTSNGDKLATKPTTGLCSKGTATKVNGSGPWTWNCTGSNGGTTNSCSASKVLWDCNTDIKIGSKYFQACNSVLNPHKNYNNSYANSTATNSEGWRYGALYTKSTMDNACANGYHVMTTTEANYAYGQLGNSWEKFRKTLGIPYSGTWDQSTSEYNHRDGDKDPGARFCLGDGTNKLRLIEGGSPMGINNNPNYTSNAFSVRCVKDEIISVNGVCGTSNGDNLTTKPTTGLCSKGTATKVSGTGPWTWSCNGIGGGTTDSCSANDKCSVVPSNKTVYSSPIQYNSKPIRICMGTNGDNCSLGDARNVDTDKFKLGKARCSTKGFECGKTNGYQGGAFGEFYVYNPNTNKWILENESNHVIINEAYCWGE